MSDIPAEASNAKSVQKEYIAHVRARLLSQEIEEGNDLHDWENRKEGEVETIEHQQGFEQLTAPSIEQPETQLRELDVLEVANDE